MIEYIGYLASVLILISLVMSSNLKLRIFNLLGGIAWIVYGVLTKAWPIAIMNACIACVNIYFLIKMFRMNEYFKTLPIDKNSEYLRNFLEMYNTDINKYFSTTDLDVDNSDVSFYILRNVVPAGFFVGNKVSENTLRVDFDYVVPAYRDFKLGKYVYSDQKDFFLDKGYNKLITYTDIEKHEKYLNKMGFKEIDSNIENKKCFEINL